jgi:hypothetical protein
VDQVEGTAEVGKMVDGEGKSADGDGADNRKVVHILNCHPHSHLLPPSPSQLLLHPISFSSLTCEEIDVHSRLARRLHSEHKLEIPAVLPPPRIRV